ncbi:MAG: hypothetical protein HGB06_01195 [Chlorobaculum sp.]|jgi:hypothetical protein|nr:hypothetical protein [Chlorobaculum sp.]
MDIKQSLIIIFFFCALFSPFSLFAEEGNEFDALIKINASDGINKKEAYIIAKAFFLSEISGCGFPDEPVKKSGYWVSETHIGLAGVCGEPIFIDINTGTSTWKNKSSVVELTLTELKKKNNK